MDHINNGTNQLLKKDPTTKIKAKILKQLKALKDNKFIDNNYIIIYLLTHLHIDFMVNQIFTSQEFLYALLLHIVASHCIILKNTKLRFLKLTLKMKITMPRLLLRFPTTSEMFPLKMTR